MKNLLPLGILFIIFLFYYLFKALRQYKMLTKGKSHHLPIHGNWEKIIVDSERCEVLFREYYEEEEIDESPTIRKLLDSIHAKNTAKQSGLSVIVYTQVS